MSYIIEVFNKPYCEVTMLDSLAFVAVFLGVMLLVVGFEAARAEWRKRK